MTTSSTTPDPASDLEQISRRLTDRVTSSLQNTLNVLRSPHAAVAKDAYSMSSILNTPIKEPPSILEDSRLEEHSDDDSDVNRDADALKHEKGQDQDANYTEEANTGYSLFSNPPRLGLARQELFDVKSDIELAAHDFEELFPFVDNVWRKYKLEQKDSEPDTETFCCRLRPSGQQKSSTPKPPTEGKQQRRKRKREDKTCPMLIRVTYVEHPIKKVKISRAVGPEVEHSHDLEYIDQNKRNSAIMDVARREAVRGFLPGSIFWKMQEEPEKMEEAGGKHMKVSDVRNVQYPWRQQNSAVTLKAHSGYTQQRTGPRQPRSVPAASSQPSTPQNGHARPHPPPQQYAPPPPQPPLPVQPQAPPLPPGTLNYPELAKEFLKPYLPYLPRVASESRPHITLTWATSLDSRVALLPGVQTAISGPETKAMTHFLRSQHDAILIGVKTALSDDPGLNCRLAGAGGFGGPERAMQPRPIIVDPRGRLPIHPNMRLLRAAAEGKALGPWVVVGPGIKLHPTAVTTLKNHGGEFLQINEIHPEHGLEWEGLFSIFHREGIKSIMVEGGGKVLSDLLTPRYTHCIDTVIMTIAPTFFGKHGVEVSPDTAYDGNQPIQTRLTNVKWQPMGQSDMVLCGHLDKTRLQPRLPGIHEFSRQAGPPPPTHGPPPAAAPPPPPPQNHAPPPHYAPQGHPQAHPQYLPQQQPQNRPQHPPLYPPPQQPPQHSPGPTPQHQPQQPHQQPPRHSPTEVSQPQPQPQPQPQRPNLPQPLSNGTATPTPAGKSPRFRHYGPPGASR